MTSRRASPRKKPRAAARAKKASAKKPQRVVPAELPPYTGTVLGLDPSSKTVGWCVFTAGVLTHYGKFHPAGLPQHHGEKLEDYQTWLRHMLATHKPTDVVVEIPYPGPRRNAYGILMMYLGALLAVVYEHTGAELPDTSRMTPRQVKQVLQARAGVSYETRKRLMVLLMNRLYKLSLKYKAKDDGKVSDADIADAIATTHVWHLLRRSHD